MKRVNKDFSVSVIVPARDEAGTIGTLVKRIPKMGSSREIIFVEGFSTDNTWREIEHQLKINKSKRVHHFVGKIRAFKQKGRRGKAGAVRLGFSKAKGQILMILDADLSVRPEELSKFYEVLAEGRADFANGSRFIYPRQKGAMRYFNHLGNRFFALIFSIITKSKISDTLCGTKALWRRDYKRIQKVSKSVRTDDPYGDFTLLLSAGKLHLTVAEVPVKYKARVYGKSKINPVVDGFRLVLLLLKLI